MTAYNDFVVKYEGGMTIMEIVAESDISRRTAYRYKAYYDKLKDAGKNLLYDTLSLGESLFRPLSRDDVRRFLVLHHIHRNRRKLLRSAALKEKHLVIRRNVHKVADILLRSLDDFIKRL